MAFLRWPQINYLDFLSSDKEPVKARDACCLKVLKKKKNTWDLASKEMRDPIEMSSPFSSTYKILNHPCTKS